MKLIADQQADGILRNICELPADVHSDPDPGCKRVALTAWPTGPGPYTFDPATGQAVPTAEALKEHSRRRRMDLAKWMERKRRNQRAAVATGEDYTDLNAECDVEIGRLRSG